MIGSILLCDLCGSTNGSRPCRSGAETRRVSGRGGIRRVRLGRTISHYHPDRAGKPRSIDLCGACRTPDVIELLQTKQSRSDAEWGDTFIPA